MKKDKNPKLEQASQLQKQEKQMSVQKEEELQNQANQEQKNKLEAARKEKEIQKKKQKAKKKAKPVISTTIGLSEQKDYFVENLAMLINSGMSILRALNTLHKDTRSPRMKKVIDHIRENISQGLTLWSSLEKTGIFSAYVVSLIRIGEESGHLSRNLEVISIQKKKERMFNSKVQTAMMYPVFVLSLTCLIGVGIAWFILPRLSTVFNQLKVDLPLITKLIIGFGNFIKEYGAIAIPSFFGFLIILGFLLFGYSKTKFIGQKMMFSIPGIKGLIRETELARMGYLLGTLLEAGIPIVMSLKSLSSTTNLHQYRKFYNSLAKGISIGDSFQDTFEKYKKSEKLVPISIQQMIIASEKSGRLSSILLEIGQIFENKNEDSTKRLSTMIEPILLFIVWAGVVFVALAIIMPIYSLVGGFQGNQGAPSSPQSAPPSSQNTSVRQNETAKKESPINKTKESVDNKKEQEPPNPTILPSPSSSSPEQVPEEGETEVENMIKENEDENNDQEKESLAQNAAQEIENQEEIEEEETAGEIEGNKLQMTDELEVNIRKEPSTSTPIIGKTELGKVYTFTEKSDNWYKIVVDDVESENYGWVFGDYITILNN